MEGPEHGTGGCELLEYEWHRGRGFFLYSKPDGTGSRKRVRVERDQPRWFTKNSAPVP